MHILAKDNLEWFSVRVSRCMGMPTALAMYPRLVISGLRINLNKIEIIPIGRITDVDGLALELGCKVGALPASYMGLPLGALHNSVVVWDGIEERFKNRLSLWKRQYIFEGGRLTLIRSTLSCLLVYFMSLFRLPR